jgi:hypothetical protein
MPASDGTVGVRQPTSPDRLIDNEVLVNAQNEPVYRQRVSAPTLEGLVAAVRDRADFPLPAAQAAMLARDVTLAQVRDHLDTVEALLTDVRTELRRRPVYWTATALTSVPSGTPYLTVVELTPAVPVVLEGYGAEIEALTTIVYRARLILGTDAGPDVRHGETLSTTANSWAPVRLSVAAGTRVAVQLVHGEVTSQTARATIAYREDP